MIPTKEEIIQNMLKSFQDVTNWIKTHPDEKFEQGPVGKWDTSQHFDHLMNSAKRITSSLQLPKAVLRTQFGQSNHARRDYDSLVTLYQKEVKNIPPTVVPKGEKHPVSAKTDLLATFQQQGEKLAKVISEWSEADLDEYLLPHPLLGKMSIRELLLWMIYHNYHHLNNLKSNY